MKKVGRCAEMMTVRGWAQGRGLGRWAPLLFVVWLAAGCGDATGPEETDLSGTWDAVSAVMTNPAQPSQSLDLLEAGFAFRLVISPTGTAETQITVGGHTEVNRGTVSIVTNTVLLDLDSGPIEGVFTLGGSTLTLDLHTGVEWDFDQDALDEPATLMLTLVRQG